MKDALKLNFYGGKASLYALDNKKYSGGTEIASGPDFKLVVTIQ